MWIDQNTLTYWLGYLNAANSLSQDELFGKIEFQEEGWSVHLSKEKTEHNFPLDEVYKVLSQGGELGQYTISKCAIWGTRIKKCSHTI